jgi:hypothetical protein
MEEGEDMKKILGIAALVLGVLLLVAPAQALIVNPATGASGFGYWDGGLGSLIDFDGALGAPYDTVLSITLPTYSVVDLVSALDCCVVGDAFTLIVDAVAVAWTSSSGPGPGLFYGEYDDLYLSAGAHTIQMQVTQDCCGSGQMTWSVSAARAAVPEPASLLLLGSGLLGLGAIAFKRR